MFTQFRIGPTRPDTWRARVCTAAAALTALVISAPASASDAVVEWNQIALAATVTARQGAVPQVRSMTIVHVSMHDAVNAVTGRYDTYLPVGPAPAGASAEAAAIAAAHYALTHLFSSQTTALDGFRAASLLARGLTEDDPGIGVGEAAAAAVVALRANDGWAQAQFPYVAPGAGLPGVWVAVGTANIVLPGWGNVTPWVMTSGFQFRPDAPPSLESGRYARDLDEVKRLGSLNSVERTGAQTDIAQFWSGSPSAIWNSVATRVIEAKGLDLSSTAQVLALMYLASADASIACWDAKYTYNFWRPITAIRNADVDGNDATVADPTWEALFATHQHPEYPSGHSTNSGAMGAMLALLFGDDPGMTLLASSPTHPDSRQWTTFSEGVAEVIEARIYSGFHFRTSDEVGARVGRQVARFVLGRVLRAR